MDAAAELGRNPVSKHQTQPEDGDEQADAGRDCRTRLARPNSQVRTRTEKYSSSLFADHVQDWQPYPVDPYSCYMYDHTKYTGGYGVLQININFKTRTQKKKNTMAAAANIQKIVHSAGR